MSNLQIQNLIEHIRIAIGFPETVTPEQMRIYASRYAEACTELHGRTMQCVQHIRVGNIAEGVRLAELKPNLVELYLTLDFTERDEWNEIVSMLGFDVPPPLPVEMARELNDAYLKLSPLEPLLRWHRLYALNGSSIQERLAVIRAIAKTDRQNLFWTEDQEKFEKVRIKQLNQEVSKAIETKNYFQIRQLHQELSSPDWILTPSPDFRRRLAGVILQDYANSLMEKFSAFEYVEATSIYATMQQVLASEQMPLPPAIQQLIRPAVQWLGETQQQNVLRVEFAHAMTALQNALEDEQPTAALERLYYVVVSAATKAGTVVPAELEELYLSEVERQYAAVRWRNRWVVAGFAVVCLLIGSLIAFGLYQRHLGDQVAKTIAMLQNAAPDEVPRVVEGISPKIAKYPEVHAEITKAQHRYDDKKQTEQNFQTRLAKVDARLDADDKPDIHELTTEIKYAVEQVEKLAVTPPDKMLFTELKRKYDRAVKERRQELNAQYTNELGEISAERKDAMSETDSSPTAVLDRLAELARRLEALQKRSPDVDDSIKEQGTLETRYIADDRKRMETRLEQEKAVADLLAAVPDWMQYQSSLRAIADFTGHPAAAEAADVLKELETVKEIAVLLQNLTAEFGKSEGDFTALQHDSASLLSKYKAISTRVSGSSSGVMDLFSPGDFLENLAKMVSYSPGAFKSTETRLNELIQRKVFPWIGEDNKWYYLTEQPTGPNKYSYVTLPAANADKQPYTIKDGEWDDGKKPKNAVPHLFAMETKKKLAGIKNNAAAVVGDIIGDMFKREDDEPGIDPIVQCGLIALLLKDMSQIDPFFASNFTGVRKIIQDSGVDQFTNHMDVAKGKPGRTEQARENANKAVKRLPEIPPLIEKSRQEQDQFKRKIEGLHPRFEWVALLTKREGKWNCTIRSDSGNNDSGDLFILRQNADKKSVRSVKIGQISSGKVELNGDDKSFLPYTPVFFVQY